MPAATGVKQPEPLIKKRLFVKVQAGKSKIFRHAQGVCVR